MHVPIDESGAKERVLRVDLFAPAVLANTEYNAVADADVAVLDLSGEYIDDVGIFDDQRCVFLCGISNGIPKTCFIQNDHHL